MTVVDVNTGKFTGSGGNLEQTVTRNNLEAAEETVRQLRLRDIGGIIVIDFIDMVLESNRDLVLRRLTEALARDRTRHQVSEVTSLGLVQLTRKKLGTGLIEAFSTTCPHCAGRGIVLHNDPIDSGSSAGGARRSEPGAGRRSKRGKKGRADDVVQVAKVPSHVPGEHPMFRAMAAATEREEGEEDDVEGADDTVVEGSDDLAVTEPVEEVLAGESDDDLDDEDDEDSDDEDEDDEDDEDEDDEDEDDDIEVIDHDEDEDDSDEEDEDSDEDSEDDSEDDSDEDEHSVDEPFVAVSGRPRRRRAAARPAGPPVS
jgi:ribonuclease E